MAQEASGASENHTNSNGQGSLFFGDPDDDDEDDPHYSPLANRNPQPITDADLIRNLVNTVHRLWDEVADLRRRTDGHHFTLIAHEQHIGMPRQAAPQFLGLGDFVPISAAEAGEFCERFNTDKACRACVREHKCTFCGARHRRTRCPFEPRGR
ncbi:uncharacterized protein PFL1_02169 [Pseudozyma flocculosa PF-1]|uniref:uncharacterized protein n=1 Tax=Pseudozyma flocculosa PF-1 TaxID=1277687 RepID=UPI000456060E|nr:uncharacterized protein PFL1_02169 [Pseudozyma flocculosa PF-1]EPQ30052.1 hypothetical protein PFL1_02169 [Pseudozyma flocculosa PF-1]